MMTPSKNIVIADVNPDPEFDPEVMRHLEILHGQAVVDNLATPTALENATLRLADMHHIRLVYPPHLRSTKYF